MQVDQWAGRPKNRCCKKCMFFIEKEPTPIPEKAYTVVGRCRRHAPITQEGYPVVFPADWCGDFKLDENKV